MTRHSYSAEEKLKAVERELGYRRSVYARRVSEGRMTQELADQQIEIFEQISADYRKQAEEERLL